MSSRAYSQEQFSAIWAGLSDAQRSSIQDLARLKQCSLTAVMRDHYPDLWDRIEKRR